jgi:1-deoxy-D-xylulose-5-phosphate reductoisomerase
VYNAANEEAVAAFLDGRLSLAGIARAVEAALADAGGVPGDTLDALLAADARARAHVRAAVGSPRRTSAPLLP